MPMIPSLQRYLIKKAPFHIALLVVFSLLLTLAVNIFLAQEKESIVRRLALSIPGQISLSNIFYVLPNKFYITGIKISEPRSDYGHEPVTIPALSIQVPIGDLLTRRTVTISGMEVVTPIVAQKHFLAYLNKYHARLSSLLETIPQGRFQLVLKNGIWDEQSPTLGDKRKTFFLKLIIKKKNWLARGWVREDRYRCVKKFFAFGKTKMFITSKGSPFKFSSEGLWEGHYVILDHIESEMHNFYSRLWGVLDQDSIKLEGYALSKMDIKTKAGQLKNLKPSQFPWLSQFKFAPRAWNPNIFILDIHLLCRLAFPAMEVKQLSFSLNNAPVQAKGRVAFEEGLLWDGKISFSPALEHRRRPGNFQSAALNLIGSWQENILKNKGSLMLYFEENEKSGIPLQKLEVFFEELLLLNLRAQESEIVIRDSNILFHTSRGNHLIKVEQLKAFWAKRTQRLKYIKIFAPFYGGQMVGRVWIDTGQMPFKVHSVLDLKDVNTHILDSFLVYFAKVYGRLNGKIDIADSPSFQIKGNFSIHKGRLSDMSFFVWLADTFRLPALRDVAFQDLSTDFFVNSQGQGLDKIDLKSEDVALNGYFYVNPDCLVNSKISMAFSRRLLAESPKFAALLKRFNKERDSLIFDFQMSGNQDAMNFKWLQTDSKDRIQEIIPDFIERKIERGIDSLFEPVAPEGSVGPKK